LRCDRRQIGCGCLRTRFFAQGDNRAAESAAGESRAEHAGLFTRKIDKLVELRCAVLEICAGTFVRFVHQLTEAGGIAALEQFARAPDALVLADYVRGATE
jgi:hypothetical protein